MEIIKKQISLEEGRSRLPGLLPDIDGKIDNNQGNYGKFVCDIDFSCLSSDTTYSSLSYIGCLTYKEMMQRYYKMRRFFKNCTYYKSIIKNGVVSWAITDEFDAEHRYIANLINKDLDEGVFKLAYQIGETIFLASLDQATTEMAYNGDVIAIYNGAPSYSGPLHSEIKDNYESYNEFINDGGLLYYQFIEKTLGKHYIPETIDGSMVPNYIYLVTINDYIKTLEEHKSGTDEYHKQMYQELGGDAMALYLMSIAPQLDEEIEYFKKLASPKQTLINLSVALNQSYSDMGVLTPYIINWEEGKYYYQGEIIIYNEESYICLKDYAGNITEAELYNFLSALQDGFWGLIDIAPKDLVSAQTISYIGVSELLSFKSTRCVVEDINQTEIDGDPKEYFGVADYDKDGKISKELKLPFATGSTSNIVTIENDIYGDTLYEITKSGSSKGTYTFKYVMGGKLIELDKDLYTYDKESMTGVWCEETYDFVQSSSTFTYNGVEDTFKYDYIDFDSYKIYWKNTDNKVLLTNVSHRVNTIYDRSKYYGYGLIDVPVFRDPKDYGLNSDKHWQIDVLINRGNNAAYEKLMKLTEINTFEDLENYQNNFFELEDE